MYVYLLLALAIVTEVTATLLLKASNGWENWVLGSASIFFYSISGVIFAFVLKHMHTGMAYAIWSGLGIACVCLASVVIFKQSIDAYAVIGMLLIVAGVAIIATKSSLII